MKPSLLGLLALAGAVLSAWGADAPASSDKAAPAAPPLANATVLIIRHAEEPGLGSGLSAEGEKRAAAYVRYFEGYTVDGAEIKLTALYAAADSFKSRRPRLTLDPLSQALGLPIHSSIWNNDYPSLAQELKTAPHGQAILICWHHGTIPGLLQALGADPGKVLPGGVWPGEQYGWLIQLRYDRDGNLASARCIGEKLNP